MDFQILNHKLVGVDYRDSPNKGGTLKGDGPVGIVEHYTAGYNLASARDRFLDKNSKVSAHITIDYDGSIVQQVPFNRIAWHAGPSIYQGYNGLNNFAIGIEHVNIGYVKKNADGSYTDPYGKKWSPAAGQQLVAEKEPRIGSDTYYWPTYSDKQIAVSLAVQRAIIAKYGIKFIVTHEEIDTRKWKTDPGPAFPLASFKALLGEDLSQDDHSDDQTTMTVSVSSLNVRSGGGTQWPVIESLNRGVSVKVLDHVGDWSYILYDGVGQDGKNGWVSTQYLTR